MGLDIYAGTFSRYYTRNWKTAAQQFCEEAGIQYSRIESMQLNEEEKMLEEEEVLKNVKIWQEQMVKALMNSGVEKAAVWEEGVNVKPYYTNKPDWDAYGALLLFVAGKLLKKKYPQNYKKNTKYQQVLEFMGIQESPFKDWSLFMGVQNYVPIDDKLVFRYPLANGTEETIGTVACLKYELTKINEVCWKADNGQILEWQETEGYPAEATIRAGGLLQLLPKRVVYSTQSLAKYAFSILWQAAIFAEKEQVGIIFDY